MRTAQGSNIVGARLTPVSKSSSAPQVSSPTGVGVSNPMYTPPTDSELEEPEYGTPAYSPPTTSPPTTTSDIATALADHDMATTPVMYPYTRTNIQYHNRRRQAQETSPPQRLAPMAPSEALMCRKLRVVMCRHGQTPANFRKLIQGQSDSGLTLQGVKQAELLGARLAEYRFDHVYVSDLGRARKTFEALSHVSATCGNPLPGPVYTTLLRERHAGQFEGQTYGSTEAAARRAGVSTRAFRPKGGESWEDVCARARVFLHELAEKHLAPSSREPVVLCMTHGGFIKEFINAAAERAPDEAKEMWRQVRGKSSAPLYPNKARNCAIYVFEMSPAYPGGIRVETVLANDASHLTSAFTDAAASNNIPSSPLRLTAPLP
ncbi:fructose-2,6-bisphosphatase [Pseudoscourfieldia marina]